MSGIQTRAALKESFNGFEGKVAWTNSLLTIFSTTLNIIEALQGQRENKILFGMAVAINIVSIIFDAACSYNKMQALNGDSGPRGIYNNKFNLSVNAQNLKRVEDSNNEYVAPVVGILAGFLIGGLGFFGKSSIGSNTAKTLQILSPVVSNVVCDIAQHVADSERIVLEKAIQNPGAPGRGYDIENQIKWPCGF